MALRRLYIILVLRKIVNANAIAILKMCTLLWHCPNIILDKEWDEEGR